MDADIKALENEVAKINPPPHPPHIIQPPTVPPPTQQPTQQYTASRAPPNPIKPPIQFHPYTKPPSLPTTAIIHQQIAARSAIAQAAQVQAAAAARLQAQAAAITAARTRTLMSAAAQAQAARAAAIARANTAKNMISSGPKPNTNNNPHSNTNTNSHSHSHHPSTSKPTDSTTHNNQQQASVGPSYTKNNAANTYNKYGKLGYHRGTNYKRYEYDYTKKQTSTIPNSSLRNHGMAGHDTMYGSHGTKPPKKKKLKATHQYQLRTAANEKWVDPTMTDWPENDFRIFCGDLGNEVSDAMLTSAFSKYPSFAKAKVVRDKRTGKSKGYGFVSFLEPHDFIRAFKEMNGKYVGNRPIKLRRSKWKERMKKVKNFKIRE